VAVIRSATGEAREIERAVQDEMFDLDLAFWGTDEKLSGALGRLIEIWPRVQDSSRAPDRRERLRARETAAMVATARWCLTSARERVANRGMHQRADAPTELPSWEHRLSVSGIR